MELLRVSRRGVGFVGRWEAVGVLGAWLRSSGFDSLSSMSGTSFIASVSVFEVDEVVAFELLDTSKASMFLLRDSWEDLELDGEAL